MRILIVAVLLSAPSLVLAGPPEVAWTTELEAPSFGSAAVADIDGDGRLEVAFGTYFGDNSVRVLNGEDGSRYWRFDAGHACVDASLRFFDLDGDGDLELVVPVSNRGWVLAFDAKSGDEVWRYATDPVECTDSPPAILDVDGDGSTEVVYGTFKGFLHVIAADGKRKRAFQAAVPFIQTGPLVMDVNGDGVRDFIIATFKGDNRVHARDGKTGESLWSYEVPGEHPGMYHGPSVGDLTGDGRPELVIGAYDGKVHCLAAKTGALIWVADPPDRFIMSPTVIADVTGDGKPEVITASGHVTVMDRRGKILWTKPFGRGGFDAATRGVSIADLTGDGKPEVAALTGSGLFRAYRGADGKVISEFDAATLTESEVASSSHGVTIADLTGDGRLDVFFVVGATRPKKHGLAVCLTGFKGKGRGWYMLRHDPENTGNVTTALPEVLVRHVEGLTPARAPVMKPGRAPKTGGGASPARPTSSRPPTPAPRAAPPGKLDLTAVHALGIQRGIAPEVLADVLAANVLRPSPEARKKAAAHGEAAFLAACLLIEAGHGATFTDPILRQTWKPGLEKHLLALAEGPELPAWGRSTAIRNLAIADTAEVRSWLLRRIVLSHDAGAFYSAAMALGQLKEARAVPMIARQLLAFEAGWRGVERYLVGSLAKAGGKDANEWLVAYLDDERARHVYLAVLMIRATDGDLARSEAKRALESGRTLPENDRKMLLSLAK